MKRGGTKHGRLFELATMLAERLSVTELYLGVLAFSCCCVSKCNFICKRIYLSILLTFHSQIIELLVITEVLDFNNNGTL
jgi:hypothetical protein